MGRVLTGWGGLCLLSGSEEGSLWLAAVAGSGSACSLRWQRAEGAGSLRARQGAAQNPPATLALCLGKIGVVCLAGTEGAQIAPIIFLGLPGSEMDPQSSARHDCWSPVCSVARGFRTWPPNGSLSV